MVDVANDPTVYPPDPARWLKTVAATSPTLAEQRAADREKMPVRTLMAWCHMLYGHDLDTEAAERAGEGATPQKRGRATRIILGEIPAARNA